jgi:hypothetical protein
MGCAIGTSGAMVPSARDSIRDKDAGYGILRTIYRFEDVLPKLVILITLITPIHKLLPAKLDLPSSIHPSHGPTPTCLRNKFAYRFDRSTYSISTASTFMARYDPDGTSILDIKALVNL